MNTARGSQVETPAHGRTDAEPGQNGAAVRSRRESRAGLRTLVSARAGVLLMSGLTWVENRFSSWKGQESL